MSYDEQAIRQANADREAHEAGGLFDHHDPYVGSMDFELGPLPSHTSDPWTSKAAAESASTKAAALRVQVLGHVRTMGEYGATADEIDTAYRWTHLTAARRLSELERAGLVVCRGDTRPSNTGNQARVYRRAEAAPCGKERGT